MYIYKHRYIVCIFQFLASLFSRLIWPSKHMFATAVAVLTILTVPAPVATWSSDVSQAEPSPALGPVIILLFRFQIIGLLWITRERDRERERETERGETVRDRERDSLTFYNQQAMYLFPVPLYLFSTLSPAPVPVHSPPLPSLLPCCALWRSLVQSVAAKKLHAVTSFSAYFAPAAAAATTS